jgi:hypothetical protein
MKLADGNLTAAQSIFGQVPSRLSVLISWYIITQLDVQLDGEYGL